MASPAPTPTHSSTHSSKPTTPFKTKPPNPNPNPNPTQSAAASPAAAWPPPMAGGLSASSRAPLPAGVLLAVLGVVRELQALGLLAGLEIPTNELSEAKACALFNRVLATFLGEALKGPASAHRPLQPALGDGRPVELLRLYMAVRARGGYAAVASWVPVAKASGLDQAAAASVKLIYAKYLAVLEQYIHKPVEEEEEVESNGTGDLHLGLKKDKFLSPVKDGRGGMGKVAADVGLAHLKRKREAVIGVLNWLRNVAKSPKDPLMVGKLPSLEVVKGKSNGGGDYFSVAHLLRRAMFMKNVRNNVPNGSPSLQSGLKGKDKAQSNRRLQSLFKQSNSFSFPEETVYYGWGGLLAAGESSDKEMLDAEIQPCGQAEVPVWTGKPSMPSDDPDMLRWLGTPILPPEKEESVVLSLDAGTIGKGRPDDYKCQFPGSIDCIRLHVAEEKIKLKRELGSAFYAMGFNRMGEDVALSWTKDEEEKFNTIIQRNLPTSEKNFWDKLYPSFPYKGRKGLVSYYYNVFQLRRRAYQNRLTPTGVDSDDDSIEPGFLYNCLGQGAGQSASRSAVCTSIQNMDI